MFWVTMPRRSEDRTGPRRDMIFVFRQVVVGPGEMRNFAGVRVDIIDGDGDRQGRRNQDSSRGEE